MSINISSNFLEGAQLPLDARTVAADLTVRDAIPSIQRYEGLVVYVISTTTSYQLQGGIANGDWVVFGSGSTNAWVQGGNAFGALGVIGTTDTFSFSIITDNVERARILTNGNIGFGTTTPRERVDIVTPTSNTQVHFGSSFLDEGGFLMSLTPTNAIIAGGVAWDGTDFIAKATTASYYEAASGYSLFFGDSGLSVQNPYTPTSRMVITPTGNVGIGTSFLTPQWQFEVTNNGASSAGFTAYGGSAGNFPHFYLSRGEGTLASTQHVLANDVLGAMIFAGVKVDGQPVNNGGGAAVYGFVQANWTNTSTPTNIGFSTVSIGSTILDERMKITSEGDVVIGFPTASKKLTVVATGANGISIEASTQSQINIQNSGSTGGYQIARSYLSDNAQNLFIYDVPNNAYRMMISSTGNIGFGTTLPAWKVHASANVSTAIAATSYSTSGTSRLILARGRGTEGSPTDPLVGDILGSIEFLGVEGSGVFSNNAATVVGFASENWTSGATGTYISVSTTPNGSDISTERIRVNQDGSLILFNRLQTKEGAVILTASDLVTGYDGNVFPVSGGTTINAMDATDWQTGSIVVLLFLGVTTVKNNTAGGTGTLPFLLAGSIDLTTALNTVLTVCRIGDFWHEIARKIP